VISRASSIEQAEPGEVSFKAVDSTKKIIKLLSDHSGWREHEPAGIVCSRFVPVPRSLELAEKKA
jgi:hypothetical protein